VKYWFQTPSSIGALRNDLTLLHDLSMYPEKKVGKAGMTVFGRHIWYLSDLLLGFRFFDDEVSAEEKRVMVPALKKKDGSEQSSKRIPPLFES